MRQDGRLDGGVKQFQIVGNGWPTNEDHEMNTDEYWVPLGPINVVASDRSELNRRWADADVGDSLGEPDECGYTTSNWNP